MTAADVTLEEGETLVVDDELLYRQITAHLMDKNGQVATHAFTGSTSDAGMPSYARSTLVSAQDSRDWHTRNVPSPSLAVRGLMVSEITTAGRWVIDDSAAPLAANEVRAPGHCFVDARDLDRLTLKTLRAELWQAAMARPEVETREPLNDGEFDLSL